jgi:hypothetical protein
MGRGEGYKVSHVNKEENGEYSGEKKEILVPPFP